jgi:hypothetical protein
MVPQLSLCKISNNNPRLTEVQQMVDSLRQARGRREAAQDKGKTAQLLALMGKGNANPAQLRNALLEASPMLSDTVMARAASNDVNLPNPMLTQVLAANPHALRSPSVLLALEQRSPALNASMMSTIAAAGAQASPMDEHNAEVSRLHAAGDIMASTVGARYLSHPVGKQYDSLQLLPQYHPDRVYGYLSAFADAERGDVDAALAGLSGMGSSPEVTDLLLLVRTLDGLRQSSTPLARMDSLTRAVLTELSEAGHGLAALMAYNALAFADTLPFLAPAVELATARSAAAAAGPDPEAEHFDLPITDEPLQAELTVVLRPNPTTGLVHVEVQGTSGEFTYEVLSLEGSRLLAGRGVGSQRVSLEHLPKGTYLMVVRQGGQRKTLPVLLR